MNLAQAPGTRFLLTGAALVVLLAGLKEAAPLLVPLILSAFLAVITAPMVLWLKERRVPTLVSVPLSVLAVIAVGSGVIALVGSSITQFVGVLPIYEDRLQYLVSSSLGWLRRFGVEVSLANLGKMVDAGSAMGLVSATLASVASMLSNAVLVLLTMAFMLFEVSELPQKLRVAIGDPRADISDWTFVATEINRYVVIKTYISLAMGLVLGLFLWIVGVDFPLLWGLLAFLLNYIPNIGAIIAAVPPTLLALAQFGVGRALVVAVGFAAAHMVIGNVIEPSLMGRRLGLSSLVVFLSLVFWGWVWGPMGMLLSVPLTMIVKIMLEHSGQWQWVATLMDSAPTQKEVERITLERISGRPPGSLRPGSLRPPASIRPFPSDRPSASDRPSPSDRPPPTERTPSSP